MSWSRRVGRRKVNEAKELLEEEKRMRKWTNLRFLLLSLLLLSHIFSVSLFANIFYIIIIVMKFFISQWHVKTVLNSWTFHYDSFSTFVREYCGEFEGRQCDREFCVRWKFYGYIIWYMIFYSHLIFSFLRRLNFFFFFYI